MLTWVQKMFEDASGVPDDARVAAFISVMAYIAWGTWAIVVNHQQLDFMQAGTGFGALAGGIGLWFGIRKAN